MPDDYSVMTLEVQRSGNAAIVTPHGRIGETEAQQLEKELVNQMDQGTHRIICDLSDVSFVTSACLGALMLAHKRCREHGGHLRVVKPQPLVRQILQVTKLVRLFGQYDSVQDALQAE